MKKNKILALLLALVMVVALVPATVFAADYSDTVGNYAEGAIDRWTEEGVVHGVGGGQFNPGGNMTRAEAAQTLTNLLKLSDKADLSAFTDVNPNAWYADAVAKCVAAGIIKGTSPATVAPGGLITRDQMFVMIGRALHVEEADTCDKDFEDLADVEGWASGYVNALVNMGVIGGKGDTSHIAPLDDSSRAEVMTVLDRLIGGYANEDGQTVAIEKGKITLVVADNVKVSGEADETLPVVVAGAAQDVDMADVNGTALVWVNVSDVAIQNAPVGTEIKAAENAENVTANGIDVSHDADKDVIIPEETKPEPEPGPSTPPPPTSNPKYNITYSVTVGEAAEDKTDLVELAAGNPNTAESGEEVTFTVTVKSADGKYYGIKNIFVSSSLEDGIKLTGNGGTYHFTMPAESVTVKIILQEDAQNNCGWGPEGNCTYPQYNCQYDPEGNNSDGYGKGTAVGNEPVPGAGLLSQTAA